MNLAVLVAAALSGSAVQASSKCSKAGERIRYTGNLIRWFLAFSLDGNG